MQMHAATSAPRRPRCYGWRMSNDHVAVSPVVARPTVKRAVLDATVLAAACLITYLLVTRVMSHLYFISKDSALLGGMWAVIATIFVIREGYRQSVAAAASRMA